MWIEEYVWSCWTSYLKHQLTLLIVQASVSHHGFSEFFFQVLHLLLEVPHVLIESVLRAVR